jgi:hypothetical protein
MVRHDFIAVGERFATNPPFHALLDNLARQQFTHFRRRSDFAVSSRMVPVFNPLNRNQPLLFFCLSLRLQQKTAL